MKVFRRNTAIKKITQLKNKDEVPVNDKQTLMNISEEFYENVHQITIINNLSKTERRMVIKNVGSGEISHINRDDIKKAIKQYKNLKATGEDNISAEMMKLAVESLVTELEKLFSQC